MSPDEFRKLVADAEAGKADAQFFLSQICMQNQDTAGMHRWLAKAVQSGVPDASAMLGHCHEKGIGVTRNMNEAMRLYDSAVAAGSNAGAFDKAQLLHKSSSGGQQQDEIVHLLVQAAKAGVVPAIRTIGYLALQDGSNDELARSCLTCAALSGDSVSSFSLGVSLADGRFGASAKKEAGHWLQIAVRSNYPLATTELAKLEWQQSVPANASPPLDLRGDFPLYPKATEISRSKLNDEPEVVVYDEVLNTVDCAYLMFVSRPNLQPASVINPDGDASGMVSQVRTNKSTYIPFEHVDIISRFAEMKIVVAAGEELACSEPMSILCYARGEYYRPHFDYFNPNLDVSRNFMKDGGQRTASAVTYLAAPEKGGGTSFPELDLCVPPKRGSTLWFRNCDDDGAVDKRSLHAGDPIEAGQKWVVTKWFRQEPTSYLSI